MINPLDLAKRIGKDIGVPLYSEHADVKEVSARIFYSAAARQSLSSIWDEKEDGKTGQANGANTLQHFKNTIKELIYAYALIGRGNGMCFEKNLRLTDSDRFLAIADEIFQIYWQTGNLYRRSTNKESRVAAVPQSFCACGGIRFLRGVAAGRRVFMSGCGLYETISDAETDASPAVEYWGLGEKIGRGYLDSISAEITAWGKMANVDDAEYLKTSLKGKYWDRGPKFRDDSGRVSLARYGQKGSETYVLYRAVGDGMYEKGMLPAFRYCHPWGLGAATGAGDASQANVSFATMEYNRIAYSILKRDGVMPDIEYAKMGEFVYVKTGYLLPTAECNLFKLYSWPVHFENIGTEAKMGENNFDQQSERVMMEPVFKAFKAVLEYQGFSFKERKNV